MRCDNGKKEIVFLRAGKYTFIDTDAKITFLVTFDETIAVVGGKPVVATLNALVNKVEDIIEALEGAARVLGLITRRIFGGLTDGREKGY